ncbi:GntR family transcriptional regulator [Actinomadura graeca]|uniref:GntR family transcriptional regulator n=1 Tax=Actinomadura graeca TaxID=2750812 RepID=A0ABX8R1D6_9ACTN|nr:GntR family transcriptional regulator [Actinomadura graeca]QXJ23782.1 GntR family transcriptional regulator [Actinomadura graeca]
MTAVDLDLLPPLAASADRRLPLWAQVAESVRDFAERAAPGAPTRLPTEVQLARHYDVSVSTVRQALAALEGEGLLTRRRRHGTFVAPRGVQSRPLHVAGPLDAVVHQQASDETRVLGRRIVPVPGELRAIFPGAEELVEFERVRYSDGALLSHARNHLRRDVGDRVSDESLRTGSMTRVLRDDLGLALGRIDNEIAAVAADSEIARLLDIEPRAPVLQSRNLTFDADGAIVDAAVIHYRADRFRFALSLSLS